jgi:hypothetical protein
MTDADSEEVFALTKRIGDQATDCRAGVKRILDLCTSRGVNISLALPGAAKFRTYAEDSRALARSGMLMARTMQPEKLAEFKKSLSGLVAEGDKFRRQIGEIYELLASRLPIPAPGSQLKH